MNRILVLGGSGFVGRAVCEQLARQHPGARIVVPSRRARHAAHLRTLPGIEVAEADVHDLLRLTELMRGCDAVVNLIAVLHGKAADFEAVHQRLPQTIVRAMRGAGVARLAHVSALGAAADAPSLYLRSKAAGEQALNAGGLAATILRPSVIFGAHDRLLNLFARLQAFAPVLPLAASDAQFQPVWVGDVAAAVVHVLDAPATAGRAFECCGPQVMSLSEIVRMAGRLAGHERPQIALPGWAGRLQALFLEMLPGQPLMSRDNLDSMRVPSVASGKLPGLAELGIVPAAIGAVAPSYLAPGQGVARLDAWRASHR